MYEEIKIMADYWYRIACEMEELDGVPMPNLQRFEELKTYKLNELE